MSDESGNIDTKINTNLYINLYKSTAAGVITSVNGASAPSTVMGGSDIAVGQRWPAANRQMNNLGFAIVKLVYNRDADTTQLQPITFNVSHYPNGAGVAKPGDVWLDYMSNASYGGAIPPTSLDTTCVATLNAYSDATITYTPSGGGSPVTQARYRINGVLDAGQTVLSNVDRIMSACDSWMTYSAALGQWSVVINKAESAAYAFTDNNIIGDIRVGATDITSSINQIEARFPFKSNRDQASFVNIQTPNGLLYPNEPVNKYSVTYDLVNDSVQAQYLANRTLEQAREDLLVSFNTTYYGIQVDAGNVISVTNADYGWNAKLFRVMKVNEASLPDGSLGARLELTEYNAQVYDDYDITQFTPAPNSDLSSPVYFSALVAPTVTGFPTATVPNFSVTVTIPATGRVTFGNLFYTTVASPAPTDWKLLANAATADSQPVINGTTYTYANLSLSAGTYYFAYLVGNDISQSALSPISTAFVWAPTGATGPAGDNGLTAVTGYKVQGQATAAPTFTTPTTGTALPSGWYASLDLALAALVPPQAAVAVGQVVWYIQGQYNSNATTLGGVPANKTAWTGPIAASVFQDIRSDNWNGSNPPVAATSTTWGTTGYYIKQSTGDMFLNSVYGRGQAILNGSNTVGTATFALVANSALGSNGGVIAYSGTILNGAIMGYATGAAFGGYFDTSGTQAALACNSTGTGAALQVNGKMTTTNSTLVSNLNAQYLNGNLASDFATAASGTAAYAANRLNGSGGTNVLRFAEGTVTGTAIATFTATNKPASNSANEWVKITIDGVALYIPAWT